MATKVESVEIEFLAKIEDLKAKIESIPNITSKEAKKMAAAFTSEWRKAKKGAEETSNAVQVVAKDAGKLAKLGGLLGGSFGGALNNIGDLSELAADGIGGMALAAGGLGLAVAGVAALGTAVASVLTDLDSYRGILSDLEKRHVVSPEQAQMIEVTSAAITVLKKYASEFAVVLTANVAPAVANFLKGSVFAFTFLKSFVSSIFDDIARTIGAFWNVITSGFSKDSLTEFGTAFLDMSNVVDNFKESASTAIDATNQFIRDSTQESTRASAAYYEKDKSHFVSAQATKTKAVQDESARQIQSAQAAADLLRAADLSVADQQTKLSAEQAERVARYLDLARQGALTEGQIQEGLAALQAVNLREIADLRQTYADQAREIVASSVAEQMTEEEALAATQRQRLADYLAAAKEAALSEAEIDSGITALKKQQYAELDALADEAAEKEKDRKKAELQRAVDTYGAISNAASGLVGDIGALSAQLFQQRTDHMSKESAVYRKEALKQFKTQKAIALAQAAINAALSFTQTMSQYPYPTNIILAALGAAASGVQIGLIASRKPSFHVGGIVGKMQPDEVPAKLTQGEAVLTKPAVARLGGANAVNALNGGYNGSMQPALSTSVAVLDGKIIDALWQGDMRGRNGLAAKVSGHLAGRRSYRR